MTSEDITPQARDGNRWSGLHAHLHDLIQIALEEAYGRQLAHSYTLKKYRYVTDAKFDAGYCMHLSLQLQAPVPQEDIVTLGLTFLVTGEPPVTHINWEHPLCYQPLSQESSEPPRV